MEKEWVTGNNNEMVKEYRKIWRGIEMQIGRKRALGVGVGVGMEMDRAEWLDR